MNKAVIICLLAAAVSMAQRQSVVVLPSIADQDAKLSPRQLDLLTDKVRSIIPNILPLKDFNLLKQGVVEERLGEEGLYLACKEGSCVGDLVAQVQADFGARCEVLSVNKQLYLKFELYGTLKGERDAGTIDQFNDLVKDFAAMLALLDKKVPVAFKKIIAESAPAAPPPPPAAPAKPVAPAAAPAAGGTKNNAEAYYKRGVEYFEKEDYDKAISELTQAIRLNPNYAEAYSNRGFAYGNKGNYDIAIADFNEAIQLDPKNANTYYNRGLAHGNKGNYDKAIADLKSALRIDPNHSGAKEALESRTAPTPVVDGVLTDSRDGKKYKVVEIGEQIWMAENLNYEAEGSKCYDNDKANCNKYGRLYNWETAKAACPSGWYLPSAEWTVLEKYVGGSSTAGTKLKATSGWNDYRSDYRSGIDWVYVDNNGNGTDEFGFLALPGGYGRSDGSFNNAGNSGTWWSASEYNSSNAHSRRMRNNSRDVDWNDYNKSYLFSVRCVQGQAPPPQQQNADKPRYSKFYISPKYQLPVGTPVPWGGLTLGLGLIWSSGVFFGIDGNFGYYDTGYGSDYYHYAALAGGGLSLGYSHDLPSHFKLAYGGSLGLWGSPLYEEKEIDNKWVHVETDSWSFAASFVKLRWQFLEASYKIFLGNTEEYYDHRYGENRSYFGVTMHELAIGFYFGGW